MNAQAEMKELYDLLDKANKAYYNGNESIISDAEYDYKIGVLRNLEAEHPEFARADSPTIMVGGEASSSFEKVTHPFQMLSMKDVFAYKDVEQFVSKHKDVIIEPKIDGLSLQVEYQDGQLIRAATRGDGLVGEDVTVNAKGIIDLPQRLTGDPEGSVVVRGEVYMSKVDFELINQNIETENKLRNARNAASGTLRQHDPSIVRKRRLRFFAFQLEGAQEHGFQNEIETLAWLKRLGFCVVPVYTDDPIRAIERIGEQRDRLPYDIDGAAVKVNSLVEQEKLGCTTKFPRWSVAFKYPVKAETAVLKEVRYQVGRSGVITPVAIFDPVFLCGTVVQKATLHNEAFMQELNLHENDVLSISKAGDIIPEVIAAQRGASGNPIQFIQHCPECGNRLVKNGAKYFCVNPYCKTQNLMKINFWCSKQGLDIQTLSAQTILKFMDAGFVVDIVSLYSLTKSQITVLDGIGSSRADTILKAIERSKVAPLDAVIAALGIDGVGRVMSKRLAEHYQTWDAFLNSKTYVSVVGELLSQKIVDYLKDPYNWGLLNFISDQMTVTPIGVARGILDGKQFCITGTLPVARKSVVDLVEKAGGICSNRLTKKTNFLIAGSGGGKKISDAERYGVQIISYDDLMAML